MGHQEKVEFAINHLGLLNKALVNVSALWRVVNESLAVLVCLLEESLTNALIHDDKSYLGRIVLAFLAVKESVLLLNNFVKLLELKVNDLLTHGVADTVAVDEDVIRHSTFVELAITLERSHEVVRQNCR